MQAEFDQLLKTRAFFITNLYRTNPLFRILSISTFRCDIKIIDNIYLLVLL